MEKQEQKKRGRPKKEPSQKRVKELRLRLTEAEAMYLKLLCIQANKTEKEFFRAALQSAKIDKSRGEEFINAIISGDKYARGLLFKTEVVHAESDESLALQSQLLKEIRCLGQNVNTIAKKANSNLARGYVNDIHTVLNRLTEIVKNSSI